MDAFDSIRDKASRLHDKLVAAGCDPLKPAHLVKAAADDLDLEIVALPKGDPALKGARALLDEQSGTICCEQTANGGEAALLIAHEIGHACAHTGSSSCSAEDIDPSCSTEAAPLGLQRVEDYGARERRELQANVFAREFLFPKSLAVRLHVDEAMTAKAIAERVGLPINLVRQQLFDVLLLPPRSKPETKPAGEKPALRPDESQRRAAAHRGSAFQLQAGPGTGKTRSLVNRVCSLLAEGVDPASILILTFSNKAAGELVERLDAVVPNEASRIWVGTFHAFGLDLLRRYHDRLGLPPNPALFDASDTIDLMEDVLPTLPLVHYRNLWDPAVVLRDIISGISRAKDELVDAAGYERLAEAMRVAAKNGDDDARKPAEKSLEVARVYGVYEKVLAERGAVDFGDLVMKPALLLERDEAARLAVQLRHRHVLVDEYQDVNRASARLLKAVAGDGKRLWVVGDTRQSIYRFRGASSSNMAAFASDYPDAKLDQLEVNYRSTKEVVDAFVSVAPHMGASEGMLPLKLTSHRGPSGSRPEVRLFGSSEDELAGIAASIEELRAAGVPLRDQAVLCRGNSRLNDVAAALEARGIPSLYLGSLFERDEIRDLLSLLSLVVDPYCDALVRVGAMPRYGLSLQDVHVASTFLRERKLPALEGLRALAGAQSSLSENGRAGVKLLVDDLEGFTIASSGWDVLSTYLLDKTDCAKQLARCASPAERMRAIAVWQLLNFIREQSLTGSGLPIRRALDRIRQLVLLSEERDLRKMPDAALELDAVRLMTVHGSKGLEFEGVHIASLTVASFPTTHRTSQCPPPAGLVSGPDGLTVDEEAERSHDHEEECLFFVAVSRARTHLRMCRATRMSNGNSRGASPFLDWFGPGLVSTASSPSTLPAPPGPGTRDHIEVVRASPLNVSDSRLGSYERCPRRFLYTTVLGLGGGRKVTAFSQTHDCLFDLIKWLATARPGAEPTLVQTEAAFDVIWKERGPVDHGYADEYRRLASRLIKSLHESGAGRRFRKAEPIGLDLQNGRVVVEPTEIGELPDGTVVLRRVRTGSKTDKEFDGLDYALYCLASQAAFGASAQVEAIHLTDGTMQRVMITKRKLHNRRDKSDELLAQINAGEFPAVVNVRTCPRCPHFFLCGAVPNGTLHVA